MLAIVVKGCAYMHHAARISIIYLSLIQVQLYTNKDTATQVFRFQKYNLKHKQEI